jgi:WD40 repeat protein
LFPRDRRQAKLRWQNGENNDEITSLDFHPTAGNFLLSGGDDGMVSVFDTNITDEDDSLIQAINHGPIHKAGFLGSDDLYALSSDQNLALHSLTLDDTDVDRPAPDSLGDLRPIVPCEYVLDIFRTGSNYVVACGSHRFVILSKHASLTDVMLQQSSSRPREAPTRKRT